MSNPARDAGWFYEQFCKSQLGNGIPKLASWDENPYNAKYLHDMRSKIVMPSIDGVSIDEDLIIHDEASRID